MNRETVKKLAKTAKIRHKSYSKKWLADADINAALRRRKSSSHDDADCVEQERIAL